VTPIVIYHVCMIREHLGTRSCVSHFILAELLLIGTPLSRVGNANVALEGLHPNPVALTAAQIERQGCLAQACAEAKSQILCKWEL
jgi:hypothetical protein